jgi:hypothetical protein
MRQQVDGVVPQRLDAVSLYPVVLSLGSVRSPL